jgi:PIN domain nuclease of toxin-antitoxin system
MSVTFGVFTGKCNVCSTALHKKKYFACSECGQFLCKEHSRVHPETQVTYCSSCFEKTLFSEVSSAFEGEIKTIKSTLFKTKEKLKHLKKEKTDKNLTFERLTKQLLNNEKNFQEKIESIKEKIFLTEENIQVKTKATQDLSISVNDLKLTLEKEKLKIAEIQKDYENSRENLESLHLENLTLRLQVQETHKENKNRVPYDRLRSLACDDCKNKIKKRFRNEILSANMTRTSIVDSVMAQRVSARPSTVPAAKGAPKEACCVAF